MLITIKKPLFEPEIRNSPENMETRFEWFMKWKDSNIDFTKYCIFIDEGGFHINMRNNWATSKKGSPCRSCGDEKTSTEKRKANSGTKRIVAEVDVEDPEFEDPTDNKPVAKGTTTAHFIHEYAS
ncbi:hypothetical protein MFLAVUS_005348 [Mucor flavus]|uniref:Transposase n=1 Tax=Mucor flavus TaxID=439312 RepID=A0ABP9YYI1_9FUNG